MLRFFFNDTATTEIYTLSLHDALPISAGRSEPTWKSPVKWMLILSEGVSRDFPPPVAPPLMPNTGPRERATAGLRNRAVEFETPFQNRLGRSPTGTIPADPKTI